MANEFDFEKYWIGKFSQCVKDNTNEEIKEMVVEGSQNISKDSNREEIITWTKNAMKRLAELTATENIEQIMMGCACQYPKSELAELKRKYTKTKDIELVHSMLQSKFEQFLTSELNISNDNFNRITSQGWGLAGKLEGNRVIATKIPKSAYIEEYFNTDNHQRKRYIYCHCPRVKEVLKEDRADFPEIYCYCGAGFYKGIWEEILAKPVQVKMRKSVMKGDDVCQFEITIPT